MEIPVTIDELARSDYGRGAERIIPGARFAVVTTGAGGQVDHVLSTHRRESAAVKALRQAWRSGVGRVHIGVIR